MKYIPLLSFLIFVFGCEKNRLDHAVAFSEQNFDAVLVLAQQSAKKVLVDFWADG